MIVEESPVQDGPNFRFLEEDFAQLEIVPEYARHLRPERALHYSRASFLVLEASLQVHRQLRIDLTAYRWDLGYQEE
jgi:hypothetical protein